MTIRCGFTSPSTLLDIRRRRAVAAQQPVAAEQPDIARPGHRLRRQLRHLVRIGQPVVLVRAERRDLARRKAGQVEVEAELLQLADLEPSSSSSQPAFSASLLSAIA